MARTKQYVTGDTLFVYDSSLIAPHEVADEAIGLQVYDSVAPEAQADAVSEQPKTGKVELPKNAKKIIGIPATDIALSELHPRVFNMIILGATVRAAGVVDIETVKHALETKLGKKFADNPKLRELNFKALQRGIDLVEEALQGEGK